MFLPWHIYESQRTESGIGPHLLPFLRGFQTWKLIGILLSQPLFSSYEHWGYKPCYARCLFFVWDLEIQNDSLTVMHQASLA